MALWLSSPGELQGMLELCVRSQGWRPKYGFIINQDISDTFYIIVKILFIEFKSAIKI